MHSDKVCQSFLVNTKACCGPFFLIDLRHLHSSHEHVSHCGSLSVAYRVGARHVCLAETFSCYFKCISGLQFGNLSSLDLMPSTFFFLAAKFLQRFVLATVDTCEPHSSNLLFLSVEIFFLPLVELCLDVWTLFLHVVVVMVARGIFFLQKHLILNLRFAFVGSVCVCVS